MQKGGCLTHLRAWLQKTLNSLPIAVAGMGRPLVVIASYSTFRIHLELIKKKGFQLLICDEVCVVRGGGARVQLQVSVGWLRT